MYAKGVYICITQMTLLFSITSGYERGQTGSGPGSLKKT